MLQLVTTINPDGVSWSCSPEAVEPNRVSLKWSRDFLSAQGGVVVSELEVYSESHMPSVSSYINRFFRQGDTPEPGDRPEQRLDYGMLREASMGL